MRHGLYYDHISERWFYRKIVTKTGGFREWHAKSLWKCIWRYITI